jgi:hypothetical protein
MKLPVSAILFALATMLPTARAFEIDLPKHYHEDLERKRSGEAEILWSELDRTNVKGTIRTFLADHPRIDGVDLSGTVDLTWTKDGRAIACGSWQVFIEEWELCFPSLHHIKWDKAKLVVAVSYDWKTKVLKKDGNAEIRLFFRLTRLGSIFSRRAIRARMESFDYGEDYLKLPFGGMELRRANQPPLRMPVSGTPAAEAPVASPPGIAGR